MTTPTLPANDAGDKSTKRKTKRTADPPVVQQLVSRLSANPTDERNGVYIRLLRVEDRLDQLRLDYLEAKRLDRPKSVLVEFTAEGHRLNTTRDELLAEVDYLGTHPVFDPNPSDPVQRRAEVSLWRGRISRFLRDNKKRDSRELRGFLLEYDQALTDYALDLDDLIAQLPEVSDVETTE